MGLFSGNSGPSFDDEDLKKKAQYLFGSGGPIDPGMSPNIGPAPMPSDSQSTPSNGPSLKQRLFGYSDKSKPDEFGLQTPSKSHEGIIGSVLKYALPALVGMSRGAGALPGLATAYASNAGNEGRENAQNQALYNTQRKEALNSPLGVSEQLDKLTPEQREAVNKYKHGDDLTKLLGLQEQIRANKTNEGFKAQTTQSEEQERQARIQKDLIEAKERKYKLEHPGLTQRVSDTVGDVFGGDAPQQPSMPQSAPQSTPRPSGAVSIGVSKKDGKKYYLDANHQKIGLAE